MLAANPASCLKMGVKWMEDSEFVQNLSEGARRNDNLVIPSLMSGFFANSVKGI
jgi:hypothetical protein